MGLFSKQKDEGISNASRGGQGLLLAQTWCPNCGINYKVGDAGKKCVKCNGRIVRKSYFEEHVK